MFLTFCCMRLWEVMGGYGRPYTSSLPHSKLQYGLLTLCHGLLLYFIANCLIYYNNTAIVLNTVFFSVIGILQTVTLLSHL